MMGEFSNILPLALPKIYNVLKDDGAFYSFTSWTMLADWLIRYQQYFKMQNLIICL
jgi:DNA modification methylase